MKTKKILLSLLSAAMILGTLTVPAVNAAITADTSWHNTTDTSFTIDTTAEWVGFAKLVTDGTDDFSGDTVTLAADLDFEGETITPVGYVMGSVSRPFKGTFDGGNHIISNVVVSDSTKQANLGLFSRVSGGTVKNLGVENITLAVSQTDANAYNVQAGAVVAELRDSGAAMSNCFARNITISGSGKIGSLGALVGKSRAGVSVSDCYTTNLKLENSVTVNSRIGGIIGILDSNNTSDKIENVYAGGHQFSADTTPKAMGIGNISNGNATITNAYYDSYSAYVGSEKGTQVSTADLMSTPVSDNFVAIKTYDVNNGYPILKSEVDAYYNKKSEVDAPANVSATADGTSIVVTEIAGAEYSLDRKAWQSSNVFTNNKDGEYTVYARIAATDSSYSSFYATTTVEVATGLWGGAPDTSWTGGEITTPAQFVQFANLVASGTTFEGETVTLGADLDMGGNTIKPVGNTSNIFVGTFDGNGHVIKNFTLTKADANYTELALFARISGTVKNLGIENAEIIADSTVTGALGTIAGSMREGTSEVTNCYVRDVRFSGSIVAARFGAIAGYVKAAVGVLDCYATGCEITEDSTLTVNGDAGWGVGVVEEGTVSNIYTANNVNNGTYEGNIVRINGLGSYKTEAATITGNNYYESCDTEVSDHKTYLAYGEKVDADTLRELTISESFINVATYDYNYGYPILAWEEDAYNVKATVEAPEGVSAEVDGDTITVDVIDGAEYSLDSKIWQSSNVFEGLNDGEYTVYVRYIATDETYSSLPATTAVTVEAGNWGGDADTTWTEGEITTPAQFVQFANLVTSGTSFEGKTVTLGADLDLNAQTIKPVGNSSSYFKGTFDGQGHTISNFVLTKPDGNHAELALFPRTTGSIKNVGIKNAEVKAEASINNILGVLVGSLRSNTASVENCYVRDAKFSGTISVNRFGTVVAYAQTAEKVLNCYATSCEIIEGTSVTITGAAGWGVGIVEACKVSGIYTANNVNNGTYTEVAADAAEKKITGIGAYKSDTSVIEGTNLFDSCDSEVSGHSYPAYGRKVTADVLKSAYISDAYLTATGAEYNYGYPILEWEAASVEKTTQNAPTEVIASVENDTITVTPINGAEYSLDGLVWTSENVFDDLADGTYTVYARYPATDSAYASNPASTTAEIFYLDNAWYLNGTYEIRTAKELQSIAYIDDDFEDKTIRIMNDIDADGVVMKPISKFNGILDGQGYVIKNLAYSANGEDTGLIAELNGTVKDLGIEGIKITGDAAADKSNASAIAAVNNGEITYCYVKNFTYSGTTWRVGVLTAYNTGNVNHCYVLNLDLTGAFNGGWTTVCEGIGMGVGRVESGMVSNCYVGGILSGGPGCRFNFGYTVNGDETNFENCWTTQYWQGSLLNPGVKVEDNYTYFIGQTLSEEQLKSIKRGWCELDGFAVDYYGLNDGYPIFERDIPVCDTTDVASIIPNGGKVTASGELNIDMPQRHIIISGGDVSGTIKAMSVEITDGAKVSADIEADYVVAGDAEITGTLTGTKILDMTDYTGYLDTVGTSGYETVYGPAKIKLSKAGSVYYAKYNADGSLAGVEKTDVAADAVVDLAEIETSFESSANTKVFVWETVNNKPMTVTYELRDEINYAEPLKVLVLGNSITWHSPAEQIDWYGARGMAASTDESDYVHVLESLMEANGYNVEVKSDNIAAFENYWQVDSPYLGGFYRYQNHKEWDADVIIFTIGANMMNQMSSADKTAATAETFEEPYQSIVSYFTEGNTDARVILGSTVITDPRVMESMKNISEENGYTYVDCKTGLTTDEYLAKDASDGGVAAHPNDAGMAEIANRLYGAFITE